MWIVGGMVRTRSSASSARYPYLYRLGTSRSTPILASTSSLIMEIDDVVASQLGDVCY